MRADLYEILEMIDDNTTCSCQDCIYVLIDQIREKIVLLLKDQAGE